MGLLSPWEIRNIRKELDVNAQDFAKALGLGVASIKRWESRAKYPGRSASILMKLAKHHGLNHISEIDNKDNTRPEGDNVVPLFPESNKLSDEQKEIDRKKIEKFDKRFSARARAS